MAQDLGFCGRNGEQGNQCVCEPALFEYGALVSSLF